MSTSRLNTALEDGKLALPDGNITVLRPPATYDVSALTRSDLTIVHGFFPDFIVWQNAGYQMAQTLGATKTAIVVLPRAKSLARGMIAAACENAELVLVDGQKTDGVDSLFKECRKRLGDLPSITKAHGRLFWFSTTDAFVDWLVPAPEKGPHGYYTTAGVFSDGVVDPGSALLADALPLTLPASMADLGAGWGYLAGPVLEREGVRSLDLIEAEALSIECAKLNIIDPRAGFHWADANMFSPQTPYDGIVMNPPFHAGRASDPSLGRTFIRASARLLAPHGKLWMVANRHLPYEATMTECFRNVDIIGGNGAFKIFHATQPKR
ncbi:MAG: methyltransferase [Pseudomonadota bacterium]